MPKFPRLVVSALSLFALGTGASHATLFDRGGGLIYDDVLNVTWLQDAQIVNQYGLSSNGMINHYDAVAFADSMSYYDSARDTYWSDWRLPRTFTDEWVYDTTGTTSELAYMYYINLGYAPMYSHDRFEPEPSSSLYNPFINMNYRAVWFENLGYRETDAWIFHFHFGSQEKTERADSGRVWLVRDGDVGAASVPEPGTLALLGLGLLGVGFARRKRAA